MKNRITSFFLRGLAVGVAAFFAQDAQSQSILYNNTGQNGGDSSQPAANGNYDFGNGEVGNEVVLGSGTGFYNISSFTVQFDYTGATLPVTAPTVELNFYENDGGTVSGSSSPGTLIWSSGTSPLSAFTPASGQTLTFTPPLNVTPADFTWTLVFAGVPVGDSAGLSIFNSDTVNGSGVRLPAVGGNYNDAWVNSGTQASPTWSLMQTSSAIGGPNNPGLQFGALISGTAIPEPSTIALGVVGACAFLARRRKS